MSRTRTKATRTKATQAQATQAQPAPHCRCYVFSALPSRPFVLAALGVAAARSSPASPHRTELGYRGQPSNAATSTRAGTQRSGTLAHYRYNVF